MKRKGAERAGVDITSAAHKVDPYPFYARLRAETPVYQGELADGRRYWLIARYDDVAAVLRDPRFAKDPLNAPASEAAGRQPKVPGLLKPLTRNMLDVDDPDHTRLRALVNRAFTPRRVEELRERTEALADELLAAALPRQGMELIRDYALPIPTTIIAELLGVPVRDRHRFARWSRVIVSSSSVTPRGLLRLLVNVWFLTRYLRRLLAERRARPREDLLSALVQAEEAGDGLSEDELLAMVVLLLIAGHETTVNLIGNGTLALLDHPDQLARLREEPELLEPAVEELLRYSSPVETATERYAREEVTVAGTTIPPGGLVLAGIASANRDERQFPDPDTLDLAREPNRHLAFGLGGHFCLGASLARLEGQIAIRTLLQQAPGLRLRAARGSLRWRSGLVLRGLEALPVAFRGR